MSGRASVIDLSMGVLDNRLSFQYFPDFTFIYWLACVVEFKFVPTSSHAENLEAVNLRDKPRRGHNCIIEVLKEQGLSQKVLDLLTLRKT